MLPSQLTPEYERALQVFTDSLASWEKCYTTSPINIPIVTDYKQFYTAPIRKQHLLSCRSWYWNQSNSKANVVIMNQFEVKICKFNSRRATPSDKAPSYKLWSFESTVLETKEKFYFVWCERGPEEPIFPTGHTITKTDNTTISFLDALELEPLPFLFC